MTIASPLLEVDRVTVRFGGLVALHEATVTVEPRTVLGVIGPNGAGKTTLFNVICGFVRPQQGGLRWRGTELTAHSPRKLADLGIARTLQGLGLFPGLTVLENVLTGAQRHARAGALSTLLGLRGAAKDEAALRERAHAVLADLGIATAHARLPGALPYGVQKRVALARALVAEPELLLLDEPASGLSAEEIDELAERVRGFTTRTSVLLVEHHMDLVMRACDRIVVLNFGEVIAQGSPDRIRADPVVAEAYLGTTEEASHA
ncbi:ABC transporter ATP-binding protein [Amycolatopsis aidingensis]|uniref:ABC transporter ATP-binding protein n=1 Tax=Amycolatopsis aidingensis TaxID=2842453 RepID=UPI001C0C3C6F|nr:ABC transporter ATP-binding protein [Amycolatopsis aidingensis]